MTVQQAIEDFLLEQRVRGNSPKTLAYYAGALGLFANQCGGELELEAVTIKTLRSYYIALQDRGLATTSIQSYVRALRAFLTWCYHEEYIDVNLPEKFRLPKAKRPTIDVLTDNEVHRLLDCFDTKHIMGLRNYCICALMLDSGLRLNEAVTICTDQLHLAEGYAIVCGKGNKERVVVAAQNFWQKNSTYLTKRRAEKELPLCVYFMQI